MKLSHVAFTFFALTSLSAFAAPNPARDSLTAIDATRLANDAAAVIRDSGYHLEIPRSNADLDYTVCVYKQTDCFRYVVYDRPDTVTNATVTIILSYESRLEKGKATDVEADSDIFVGRLDLIGEQAVLDKLLPRIEREFSPGPSKTGPGVAPRHIKILQTAADESFGFDNPYEINENLVVNLSDEESGRAGAHTNAITYLVRVKLKDDVLQKIQIKRLHMENLLK